MKGTMPIVVERDEAGVERYYDLPSRMLQDRIVFMTEAVDDSVANAIVLQILYLEGQDSTKPIKLYINSPGGVVMSGLAIYDAMQTVKSPIETYVLGQACSLASLLSQAGTKGKRFILPHARMMIHQPSGGTYGKETDMRIQMQEMSVLKKMLTELYVKHNSKKKKFKDFEKAMEIDTYMSAQEALDFGLVDHILNP